MRSRTTTSSASTGACIEGCKSPHSPRHERVRATGTGADRLPSRTVRLNPDLGFDESQFGGGQGVVVQRSPCVRPIPLALAALGRPSGSHARGTRRG